jgi:16S rRNA (cytosine967-C5)-methyltransferase
VVQPSARRVALAALKTWREKKDFADRIISRILPASALASADRAFAIELFYGVLRNLTLLDFWIASLRPGRLNVELRDILRLGFYQLFITKTTEHAAVYETVALAQKRLRPVVNGILRNAARRRQELQAALDSQSLEVRFSHPHFLIDRWSKQFGAEASRALCEWNNRPPPIYARINQLKIDRQIFLERYREARLLPNFSNFVNLPSPQEALDRGDCYIQDPSTAIACQLLKPEPGEKILDACAAPGGKTVYLAELMQNNGLIVACDRDADRLSVLKENLARLDVRIAKIVRHDWSKQSLPEEIACAAPFDRILVDAPCSNTGVMRRRVDVRWRLKSTDFVRMQERQVRIVGAVLPLLKRGGTLVYSTCSLEPEENEGAEEVMLHNLPVLQREAEQKCLPFADHFDGAFVARLRRTQ